jgi:hypothetical protein
MVIMAIVTIVARAGTVVALTCGGEMLLRSPA